MLIMLLRPKLSEQLSLAVVSSSMAGRSGLIWLITKIKTEDKEEEDRTGFQAEDSEVTEAEAAEAEVEDEEAVVAEDVAEEVEDLREKVSQENTLCFEVLIYIFTQSLT